MELRRAVRVDTLDVARAQMREPEPASRIRDDDLPRVVVPGKDQMEHLRDAPHDSREVAEKNAEIRGRVGQRVRSCRPRGIGLRADADDLDAPPAQLHLDGLVAEERHVLERADRVGVDPLRERVAAVREVVVAEHDVGGRKVGEQTLELAHSRSPRDEVARDADEVRSALDHPVDRLAHGSQAARRNTEVQIGEVRDTKAVELGRQTRELDVDHLSPQPAGLEPRPPGYPRDRGGQQQEDPGQTDSFSVTGATETTWRLNFSSELSSPAATPTSCERWRIGIWKSFPVCFCSFDCHASRERWQSGQGVTIASAPASFACSIGWMSSASATSSRAWMIGKPQHLIFAG